MPRSKSSSCVHENADCNCKSNTGLFKRKVISEHERSEWHNVAMSMVLLLMHVTLLFKLGGLGLSFNPIELPLYVKSMPNAFSSADDVRAEQLAQTAAAADPLPEPIRVPEYGGSGTFAAIGHDGKILGQCPLKHTSVVADVNDGIARVSVTQKFHNPFHQNIQAVYAFPLDEHCAVESMRMLSGKREILGSIKPREEAAEIYRLAAAEGRATALLEEERPNIFTQSVANVSAGEDVSVTLNYTTALSFKEGDYTFTFPTVVGPRFMPGSIIDSHGTGTESDTSLVPDASRISPPHPNHSMRSGTDISMKIKLHSVFPISGIKSKLHAISTLGEKSKHPTITLAPNSEIPNKDFVMSWHVGSKYLQTGVRTHRVANDGYVAISFMPPDHIACDEKVAKEFIFLVDCSGSQQGLPIEKAKDTLLYIVEKMGPDDTLQILAFSNDVRQLFDKPRSMGVTNKSYAKNYIYSLTADGGTFMAPAVEKACNVAADPSRLRIVSFMTDGFVGNDSEIIGMVRKFRGSSRWFAFGTGDNVNRYLIDSIARQGGGEAEYVYLNSPSGQIAESFWKKISSPLLTDIKIAYGKLPLLGVVPDVPCDLWSQRPLTFIARYSKPASGVITVTGNHGKKLFETRLFVKLPAIEKRNAVLSTLWARQKVEQYSDADNMLVAGGHKAAHVYEITKLGLEHHLLTPYTSFVAVDDSSKRPVETASRMSSIPESTNVLRQYVEGPAHSARFSYQPNSYRISPIQVDPRYGQSNQVGQINNTYMGIKRFYADDFIGNLCQNIGQLIGKWISEWVNGFFADTVKFLMHCIEALILNPFFALRGICNPAPHLGNPTLFFYIRSAIDLVYGVAGGFLLLSSLREVRRSKSSPAEQKASIYQCCVIALLLISGPWIYRVVFQLTDVFVTRSFVFAPECTRPIGDALCSALKGGLMAGAGMLAHAFAPFVGGAAGGLVMGLIGEIVALVGLIVYCGLSIVLILQLVYVLIAAIVQSFMFTLSIITGPIAFACGGTNRLQKFSAGYVTIWIDLFLWLASSVLLITALRYVLFSDMNPWFKIMLAMCNFQAMIFAPLALSYLKISPVSRYMGLNPIQGLAAGITQLAKMASEMFARFSTPR